MSSVSGKDSIDPGRSLRRDSRYYLDPREHNGEVKIIKPADPEKLAKVKLEKSKSRRKDFLFAFNGRLSKSQIARMKDSIIL